MNIDRDDEYATRYEAAPTIEEQIAVIKGREYRSDSEWKIANAILASLEKLAALERQPVPVEPAEYSIEETIAAMKSGDVCIAECEAAAYYIDTLQSALQRAQEERDIAVEMHETEFRKLKKAESLNRRMVELLKRLSFLAQTTGGTAGRDDELVKAIDESAELLKEATKCEK